MSGHPTWNPFLDFQSLSALLTDELERGTPREGELDGSLTPLLLAAGLHQILEDYLHRVPMALDKAAARFATYDHPLADIAAAVATKAAAATAAAHTVRPEERELVAWGERLARLLQMLADAVVGDEQRDAPPTEARQLWRALRPPVDAFPKRLRETIVRVPNSFGKFDQLPEDCVELTRRFAARWSDRARPLLVLGIRTSGTYIAPVYAGLLRKEGYTDVEVLTVRPRRPLRRSEARRIRALGRRDGLLLIADDPPATGRVVARVIEQCVRYGVPRESVVLMLQLLGADSLPEPLQPYASVVMTWREWAIHARMSPPEVRRVLTRFLAGREICTVSGGTVHVAEIKAVEQVAPSPVELRPRRRHHTQAVFKARVADADGVEADHYVFVRGTGLGYFADHPRAVAAALDGYVTDLYGIDGGVLYRAWLPDEWRVDASPSAELERRIASYVLARRERLPVDPDLARRAVDQVASWELVADMLGSALLGRLRILVAPFTWAAARLLVAVSRPSVIDGSMEATNWFRLPSAASPADALKSAADERSFSSPAAGLSFDSTFDLASAAANFDVERLLVDGGPDDGEAFSERLLRTFEALSQEQVDSERWFLYQLLQNCHELRRLAERSAEVSTVSPAHARRMLAGERALAHAHQRYVGNIFFGDLAPPASGELCAFDVDWVLETRWLDFPAITPNGAVALRALIRHGFRPVLATARSLDEVRGRCRAYRLAGGVAEYGAVAYDHCSGRAVPLLSPAHEAELAKLREVLARRPGVYLDPAYRHIVRAIRVVNGKRRRLDPETIDEVLAEACVEGSLRALPGGLQTDFAPVGLDKGTGLRALANELGVEAPKPLAFAIGDDLPDIPMLELAQRPFAPMSGAKPIVDRTAGPGDLEIVDKPFGEGVLAAVTAFLGHDPKRCGVCALPTLSPRTKLITIPLSAADGTRRTRIFRAAELAALLFARR